MSKQLLAAEMYTIQKDNLSAILTTIIVAYYIVGDFHRTLISRFYQNLAKLDIFMDKEFITMFVNRNV